VTSSPVSASATIAAAKACATAPIGFRFGQIGAKDVDEHHYAYDTG
jgi:hypothetical protein